MILIIIFSSFLLRGLPAVTVHANCMKGNEAKVASMKYWNIWLLEEDGKTCKAAAASITVTATTA